MNRRDFVRFTLAATLTAEVNAFAPPISKGLWATPASQVNGALAAIRDRQLLLAISQQLEAAYIDWLAGYTLDYHDAVGHARLRDRMSEVMEDFRVEYRVVNDYVVVCDDSNNPPSVIDTGIPAVIVAWRTERRADRYTRWSAYPIPGLKLEAA